MRDRTYPTVIRACKLAFKALGQRITLEGTDNIPTTGPFLLASNHISYVDFIYAGLGANPSGRLVRFMAKRELFKHRVSGPLMRSMHHIEVDREDGLESYRKALDYLAAGEAVGIFPEATISRAFELKDFKTGAARIAGEAGVPLIPVVVWGTQRLVPKGRKCDFTRGRAITVRVGAPLHPTGADPAAETAVLKAAMAELLDTTIRSHPDQEPGAWWIPAAYGGTAPSLEEARELEVAERKARIARRQAERKKR
ncbi:MAG: lysophospholipid acyltransferase family protein [Nocardioidaceae bacterium]